jgi:hypothetical protein
MERLDVGTQTEALGDENDNSMVRSMLTPRLPNSHSFAGRLSSYDDIKSLIVENYYPSQVGRKDFL